MGLTGATTKHGEDATAAQTHQGSSGTWWSGTVGFSSKYWTFANNRLPHLKTTTEEAFIAFGFYPFSVPLPVPSRRL